MLLLQAMELCLGNETYIVQSYPDYLDLRDRNRGFDGLAAYTIGQAGLDTGKNQSRHSPWKSLPHVLLPYANSSFHGNYGKRSDGSLHIALVATRSLCGMLLIKQISETVASTSRKRLRRQTLVVEIWCTHCVPDLCGLVSRMCCKRTVLHPISRVEMHHQICI
jgi:hypothetical protein